MKYTGWSHNGCNVQGQPNQRMRQPKVQKVEDWLGKVFDCQL